jgi:hypothetical protein
MSMSCFVKGFIPPDEKYQKMLKAYRACEAADVPVPESVTRFFNDEEPDPAGTEVSLSGSKKYQSAVKEWHDDGMCTGYEVDLRKLPEDIKIIRFVNSW